MRQLESRLGPFMEIPRRHGRYIDERAAIESVAAISRSDGESAPGDHVAKVRVDSVVPVAADPEQLIAGIDGGILGGTMSENTKRVIGGQVSDIKDPVQARALAVGLAIGGPEFQRQ